jgi:uncharacterized protein YndB with AHSA1/START domain
MSRQHIEKTATTTADAATVYALLRDGASYPTWSPIESFELEREGQGGEPEGIGALRVFRSGKVTGRDTIAELVENRRLAYTHESSLPVKNYRASVDLTPVEGGTQIRWVSEFEPKIPGTGALMRRGLDKFIAGMTDGLAEHATRLAADRAAA